MRSGRFEIGNNEHCDVVSQFSHTGNGLVEDATCLFEA